MQSYSVDKLLNVHKNAYTAKQSVWTWNMEKVKKEEGKCWACTGHDIHGLSKNNIL